MCYFVCINNIYFSAEYMQFLNTILPLVIKMKKAVDLCEINSEVDTKTEGG